MKNLIKILSVILCIIPICVFGYLETRTTALYPHAYYYSSNKILLFIIELLNIFISLFIFNVFNEKINNKAFYIALVLYLILISLIPCYKYFESIGYTEPSNYSECAIVQPHTKDIFGLSLDWLYKKAD